MFCEGPMIFKTRSAITCATFALGFAIQPALAASIFANWDDGTLGGLTFAVTETETSGFIQPSVDAATDPTFIADFADEFSTLQFQAPADGADLLAEVTFSQALPTGARLLAFDLDFFNEIFTITSDIGTLTLLEQGETQTGAVSALPTYDALQGTLTSQFQTFGDNLFEYSLFDVSGVTSLDIGWVNGRDSGSRIAITLPATVGPSQIPLPAGMPLFAVGLAAFGVVRLLRRSVATAHPAPLQPRWPDTIRIC